MFEHTPEKNFLFIFISVLAVDFEHEPNILVSNSVQGVYEIKAVLKKRIIILLIIIDSLTSLSGDRVQHKVNKYKRTRQGMTE